MNESIQVTDLREMTAVMNGDIQGERFSDGEVYAEVDSLIHWRNEQPVAALELSMQEAP